MKRWIKRLAIGLVALIILLGATILYLLSDAGLRRHALPRVSAAIGMPVEADRIQLSVTSGIEIEGLAVGPKEARLIDGAGLMAGWRLGDLLDGKVALQHLTLADATITIIQAADGSLNLPAFMLPDDEEEPATPPPVLDLRDLILRDVAVSFRREGEAPVSADLTIASLKIPVVANGETVTLAGEMALMAKRGEDLVRIDEIRIDATADLSDDLQPGAVEFKSEAVVGVNSGEVKLESRRMTIAAKAALADPEMVLEQLAIRQFRGELAEGTVDVSGAWNANTRTGSADIDAKLPAGGIHAVAATILAGLDLGNTAISYKGSAKVGGNNVSATGIATIKELTAASKEQGIEAIAPLDVALEHELSIADGKISVTKLAVAVDQSGRKIVNATLLEPLRLGGDAPTGALLATVTDFDLSVVRPFLPKEGPQLQGGKVSGEYKLATASDGHMTIEATSTIADVSVKDKDLFVPSTTVRQSLRAAVVDTDQLVVENFTLDVSTKGQETLALVGTGSYRMSTGEGGLKLTTFRLSPQAALTAGLVAPGLKADEWSLPTPLVALTSGTTVEVKTRGAETTLAGSFALGPIAGRFAGTEIKPVKATRLSIVLDATHRSVENSVSLNVFEATVEQNGGGVLRVDLPVPAAFSQTADGSQSLKTKWRVAAKAFDLGNWRALMPPDGIQLEAGLLDGELTGDLDWQQKPGKDDAPPQTQTVASAKGSMKAKGVRLAGKDSPLPPTVIDAQLTVDGNWDAKAQSAKLAALTVSVIDADGNRIDAGASKAVTLDLRDGAVSSIPFQVKADVAKLTSFAGLMPKDSATIQSGTLGATLAGTLSYPSLATTLTVDATVANLGLVPADATLTPAKIAAEVTMAADWDGAETVKIAKAQATVSDADGNRVLAKLTKPSTLFLPPKVAESADADKPATTALAKAPVAKQSTLPFELTASVAALEKFAGLAPKDAPRPTSGTLNVTASGTVGYPKIGGQIKADVKVADLGLKLPEAGAPTLPKLMALVSLDGAWEPDVEARLSKATIVLRDANKEVIDLEARLNKPGTFSLKKDAPAGAPVAVSVALTIPNARKAASLAPAGALPVKLAGGSLKANADASINLSTMAIDGDLVVLLDKLIVQPDGAAAPLPAISGDVKGKIAYAEEWLSPSIAASLRDSQGSLLNLNLDGKLDPKLIKPGSSLRIRSTDVISVDRLLALLPETAEEAPAAAPAAPPESTIEAPTKQNLAVSATLAKVTYKDMALADLKSEVKIVDGKATIESLNFIANGGPVAMTGTADLAAAKGLPFSKQLKATQLALGPVFTSFVPKAGAFMKGELSSFNSQSSGPDVAWEVLSRTLKSDFSGGIANLRLTPSGKLVTDLVIEAALFKTTGLGWDDFVFGGGTLKGRAADGRIQDLVLSLTSERLKVIVTGSLSLVTNEPDLRIDVYGGGSLAAKSFINAPVDENGFAKLNDTIILRSWDKKRILANNAASVARAAGVSGKDAALIGAGSQVLEGLGLFGKKKPKDEPPNNQSPKQPNRRSGGLLNALGQAAAIGLGAVEEREQAKDQESPKDQTPNSDLVPKGRSTPKDQEEDQEDPPPKKRSGLDDFLK